MKVSKRIFSAFICLAIICGDAFAAPTDLCRDDEYAELHPDECPRGTSFDVPSNYAIGGALLIGGTAVALGAMLGNASAGTPDVAPARPYADPIVPTLQVYNMVGGDVDNVTISGITSSREYAQNNIQYDDIRAAYSLARGYTGAGTNIAVLDTPNWHGKTVTDIAGGFIAPNANIERFHVTDTDDNFIPFDEIGNIIADAANGKFGANVFNASWSSTARAYNIHSREQLVALTSSNFITQVSNAATKNDAIFVFAAGNDSDKYDSSALSAMPLVMPEMNGHFVNVVAWDSATGQLADFSNACGITKNYCITAPGTDIDTKHATNADGTSFAAPIVSAAIAVIREAFPYMQSTQITSLLFETARDLGVAGIDTIYGHGMLDLERATRPVGATLVPISDTTTVPLQETHVSGAVAHNIQDANIKFAFVDSYGRAFTTNLGDNISIRNPGRAFTRLTGGDNISFGVGNLEMGFSNTDLMFGDGLLATDGSRNLISFIGARHKFNIGNVTIDAHARFGFANPGAAENSMIESFDNITVANVGATATFGDWKFGFGLPDTIVGGKMNLRMPVARAANGNIMYGNAAVDMASRPAYEYTVGYKFMSMGFIDNPFGTDEAYIMARGKWAF